MGSACRSPWMIWVAWLAACGCIMSAPALAMTPAALVAEIAVDSANQSLAACEDIRVRRGAVQISKRAMRWMKERSQVPFGWHADSELMRLEDVRLILLFRSPERCDVLLSDRPVGRIPVAWRRNLPFQTWKVEDEEIHLQGQTATELARREQKVLPVPFSRMPPLRMYHHGRLEIHFGLHAPKARKISIDDSVSLHLEGPGDEARFLFRSKRMGSLIVERTPGDMPNLDMLIGEEESSLVPRGMVHVDANQPVMVVFRYRGAAPLDLDVGFLFSPDPGLECEISVRQISMHAWRARLMLRNMAGEPLMLWRPSPATVEWYADSILIAAAHPGRKPETIMVAPAETLQYTTILAADMPHGPDEAHLHLGDRFGTLSCRAE